MLSLIDFLWKTDNSNWADELSVLLDDFFEELEDELPQEITAQMLDELNESVTRHLAMIKANNCAQPYQLVPEIALLERLPSHQRKRFYHALTLMHQASDPVLTWEQIANASAISPYHFHRQFSALFNETPGHYLSRYRLQLALSDLLSAEPRSTTAIAQDAGFSSSQALAKALKRELGLTASQIKAMATQATPRETMELMARLAHPSAAAGAITKGNVEAELGQAMPTEVIWYPQRGMKVQPKANPDWDKLFERYGKKSLRLMGATPINQLESSWSQIKTQIGDWQVDPSQYDVMIPEGYYLCAEVYVVSDIGYSSALEALFACAEQQGLQLDEAGYLLEYVRDIELTTTGGVTFSFQIPICS
ncbi:helix-turn-helix transcriptional regulator [Motilimonas eburnea]|uniref:helix-turn-helix transcriptional regulator n=1 Tax=Motilimonas eburnea TaxID=1737488 RepID=UPI001E5D3FE1|nr:helix-turn-helix transcriptional regulator [Motilimonas eburnea]MCE2571251.1 helix-turn-helix transcriptional regulator [Motilimonas eburnea]